MLPGAVVSSPNRQIDIKATLTIEGVERDYFVRGWVIVEPFGATIDGEPDVLMGDDWWPIRELGLSEEDVDCVEETMCDVAMSDDTDECQEWPESAE